MRLLNTEVDLLKNRLRTLSSEAKLYLFGSRIDDDKKGGDIDLLVVSKKLKKKDLRLLRIAFFEVFGEQKLDIVLDDGTFKNHFTKLIFQKAVLL
ncbi:MAG: nucleotidyltransferase domain-containing protein [Campylobacterota bacterium]|nr:nucleotidyltransferase domain-containing protein [Campylobacterota bacterium]